MKNSTLTIPFYDLPSLVILLFAWVFVIQDCSAHSCAPGYRDPAFIHQGNLPSNARGVLFLTYPSEGTWYSLEGYNDEYTEINSIPNPIDAQSFTIKEIGTETFLKVAVQRLNIEDQVNGAISELNRSFYIKGANGLLLDVTNAVKMATGLFRVGPAGGFDAGKTYEITYIGNQIKLPDRMEYLRSTTGIESKRDYLSHPSAIVTIDGPLKLATDENFGLSVKGSPELMRLPILSGMLTDSAVVQELDFVYPGEYDKYRNSLLFFTQRKAKSDEKTNNYQKADEYVNFSYVSNDCRHMSFGVSETGLGKEWFYSSCGKQGRFTTVAQIRGYIGLLEVEDRLHQTPLVELSFEDTKEKSCTRLEVLMQLIDSGDPHKAGEFVCQMDVKVAANFAADKLSGLLTKLANETDSRARYCAKAALEQMTGSPRK